MWTPSFIDSQLSVRQRGLRGVASRDPMRSKRQRRIDALRRAIDCLPERTKTAMLDGIDANTIIVGAYTDRRGGVCPMLAAHRHGGRTNLLAFAKAWDRFCGAKRPRLATERELSVLKTHLEAASLGVT